MSSKRAAAPRIENDRSGRMRARVLIVDDDEVYLEGMKELLEDAGYDVFLAGSFEDGEKLRDTLRTSDHRRAARRIQRPSTDLHRSGALPAIVVTGFDDTVLRADADVFGASYLVKPI